MNAKSLSMPTSWRAKLAGMFARTKPAATASPPPATHPSPDGESELQDDPRRAITFGYMVILLGLGSFAFWSMTVPIAEGVSAPGVVVVESKRKVVSHISGGTVIAVHIRENQQVKEGDVLLKLDATRAQAAHDGLLGDYVAASARLARLIAEQTFAAKIEFSDDLVQYAEQLGREDILLAQTHLFRTRQQAFRSEQAILNESMTASGIQASGIRQQLAARRQQISLLQEEIQNSRPLVEAGYSPRNRLLEQERQLAELTSVASDLHARIAREGSTAAEIRLRILQRRQEYLKEVETQSAEARREVASLGERLKDARLDLERTVVRAPVDGQVVALAAQAPGTIITPGAKLMEVVPADDKLLLDVQVPIQAAHRVKPGIETDIRISVFPETPNLIIEGIVQSISADRHEPQGLAPYYLARIEVSPTGIQKLQGRQLRPGMSTDVVIKTGERSFMTYLLSPINRRLFESFREP